MNYHLNHTQLSGHDIPFNPEDWFSELDLFAECHKPTKANSISWLKINFGLSDSKAELIFRKWKIQQS